MQGHTDLGLLQFCKLSVILMVAVPLGTSVIAPDRNDNPVEFIGFEDGDLDVTDAEVDIGRTLTDASIETVFVVSTLQFKNSIYVPWSCAQPGSRQVSVYDGNNLTIPLSYVYGKPGKFTPGYLSFPTPLRYLSLTTLSQKVAWLKKGLALRLRVRNDSISEEMWSNSTGDLRRSFIHRIVNETLTRSFQRVTRTEDYLDGTIYVRGDETIEYKGGYSLPGSVPKYSKCDRSHLALNETADGVSYQYTVCRSWRPLESDNISIVIFWVVLGVIVFCAILQVIVFVLASQHVGFFPRVAISFFFCAWSHEERHPTVTFPNKLDPIPTSFTIMSILRARNPLSRKIKNSVAILRTGFLLLVSDIALYLAAYFAPLKFFDLDYLLEDISVFSTCWLPSKIRPTVYMFWLLVIAHILTTLGVFIDVCFRNKRTTYLRKYLRVFIFFYFFIYIVALLSIIFYTAVGLILNYPTYFIGSLALAKVVVFDILKFTRVNISGSPVVASCSAAAWQALGELQDAISAKVFETTSFSTETTDSTPSQEKDAEKYSEELRQQFEDVVCQLCKKCIFSTSPMGSTEELEGSTKDLENVIISDISWYICKRIGIIMLLLTVLLYFQNLIVNFEQLSDVKGITMFFVPTVTVLIALVGPIRGEKLIKFTNGQKTDAKLYFLNRMKTSHALATEGASEQTVAGPTAQPSSDIHAETIV